MKYLLILIVLLQYNMAISQSKETEYKEALRLIDIWLDAQRDFDRLPGLSVAIGKDQEIVFSKGYGYADVENKIPMTPETIGSICSISKLFTSIAIMQLWEQGKLRLDDSISALLPAYNLKQQYGESVPVTLRSILTHSSGLPREAAYSYWSGPDFYFPTLKEMNQKLKEQQTLYPSSTYFQYSNLGMALLGEVITSVSKSSYETYIDKNVLQPLNLTHTRSSLPRNLWGTKMATGYSALYRDGTRKKMPLFQTNGIAPAAGFSSNVTDLLKFAAWQFRVLNGKQEILRPSTLKEMQRVHWLDPDGKVTWGLGFLIFKEGGTTYLGHDGSCPGYRSLLTLNPKTKFAVSVLINGQGFSPGKFEMPIFKILDKVKEATDTTTKNIDLEVYAGKYDSYDWSGENVILPWKGKLAIFNVPSNDPAEGMSLYKYISKDTFRRVRKDDETLGEVLHFERDANGKVIRYHRNNNYSSRIK